MSGRLTPAARTRISIWPARGTGVATCSTRSAVAGPFPPSIVTARMIVPLQTWLGTRADSVEGRPGNEGSGAVGPVGDDIDRHARQLLHARQVTSGIIGEARKLGDSSRRLAPSGQRFVDRHHFRVTMRQQRRGLPGLAAPAGTPGGA